MVRSINKQKVEISKVLIDTRVLQKDINTLGDKLSRTFAVTDELIFKVTTLFIRRATCCAFNLEAAANAHHSTCSAFQDAKKDEAVRKCYRFLANLHEACNTLIETVERSGAVQREIRDLEDQVGPRSWGAMARVCNTTSLSPIERPLPSYPF
jgi:hypothetical protein